MTGKHRPGPPLQTTDTGRKGDPFAAVLGAYLKRRGDSEGEFADAVRPGSSRDWLQKIVGGRREVSDQNWLRIKRYLQHKESADVVRQFEASYIEMVLKKPHARRRPSTVSIPKLPTVDLVGVGALNYDAIVPYSKYDGAVANGCQPTFAYSMDREECLSNYEELQDVLTNVTSDYGSYADKLFTYELGGSTFNVLRIVSTPGLGLTTAFVGVSGEPPPEYGACERHYDFLQRRNVFVELIEQVSATGPDTWGGACVSVVVPRGDEPASRSMGTWPGVNVQLSDWLVDRFWHCVDLLSTARAVHVTSLFDSESARWIARALEYATARHPDLLVFFDPGHLWAEAKAATVDVDSVGRILGCTSALFVNDEELRLLSERYAKPKNLSARPTGQAKRVLRLLRDEASSVIVVKHGSATAIYRGSRAVPIETALPDSLQVIEDDTGAGDVFAAGFLVARLLGGTDAEGAAQAGMRLARAKLQQPGALADEQVTTRANWLCFQ
jgi:sugar/nucleoside kinase (ribokinase family)